MRGLLLTDAVRHRIQDHVAWADLAANWYYPERDKEPPGDNPAFVMMLEVGFRVVYTQTVIHGRRLRHLSVSVDGSKYPNEVAAFTIATMFGFTGGFEEHGATTKPGEDWMCKVDEGERCIVFGQEVR